MTDYLVKRTSKLLFPSLARDERKRLMRNILLVVMACLVSAGGLAVWILWAGASNAHLDLDAGLSLWSK
jgi:hypothetical protein